jgi:ribosomal protein S18 acetylase RimI-like enzyme
MSDYYRWKRMKSKDAAGIEKFLREKENDYVGACGRFIDRDILKTNVFTLSGREGELSALMLYSRGSLLPVLCGAREIPRPDFLSGFLQKTNLHSAQGLKEEVLILERKLAALGWETAEENNYDLMRIDKPPNERCFLAGPADLVIRAPQLTDLDAAAALHIEYEKEEVLPKGAVASPLSCRTNIANLITKSRILAAELGGRLVGKININAISFTRFQVGGVYVLPAFRGLGIATRMAAEFVSSLILQGRGVTLFVKKANLAAKRLYAGLGFSARADYRISYY